MIKFAILSGAYKNAGDFLIVKRCKEILRYVYPHCEFAECERRKPLEENLKEVNLCDFMVMAGGPAYRRNLYPAIMPLMPDLNDITIPIVTMGVGQKCIEYSSEIIKKYQFTEKTVELLKKIQASGVPFSCRDWASVELLRINGFQNTVMTGCTAWYDIAHIDNFECNIHSVSQIKTVYLSDPALPDNCSQIPLIIDWLKTINPGMKIKVIFHRGIGEDSNTDKKTAQKIRGMLQVLEDRQVEYIDISYGADGFKVYEECDLHIGYRVHAHIYNMSIRKASILIQEDSRGGV